jgi:hypothetical protein
MVLLWYKTRQYSIRSSDEQYDELVKLLKDQTPVRNHDREILNMILSPELMAEYLKSQVSEFKFEFKGDDLYINGEKMETALTSRIRALRRDGKPVEYLLSFLRNVAQNPNAYSIREIYEFLEKNDLPITEDGHFLAYKKVTHDYKDCYTKKIDNSIGAKPFMDRKECDDNRNNTCSRGLHFASYDYMREYSGERIIIVKINPRDVVSFPTDYNLSKGRCCRYEVIGEVDETKERITSGAVDTKSKKLTTKVKKNAPTAKKKVLKDLPKALYEYLEKCKTLEVRKNGTKEIFYIIGTVPAGTNFNDVIEKMAKTNPEINTIFNQYKLGRSGVQTPVHKTANRVLKIRVRPFDPKSKYQLMASLS